MDGGVVEDGPGVELGQVGAGFAPGVRWGDPAQDPFGGQGFGGGAGGLEDAFGGDVGAARGLAFEVGGFGVGAGGVEGDDGVAAAVLQPVRRRRAAVPWDEGGGEQGAGEDLFAGGVEERVAAGAADGGHEVPGQPGGGFDPVGVGDLADRAQGVPPPCLRGGRRCLAGRTTQTGPSSARDPLVSAHRSALLEVATTRPGAAQHGGHGQRAGLVRPRPHDDQGDVLPGHPHVASVQAPNADSHLIARDRAPTGGPR